MDIQPRDPSQNHFRASIAKSVIRIVAAGFLIVGNIEYAGIALICAEILGILEELV